MSQSIEEQLKIMKAYSEGRPVYRRLKYHDVGELVEEKNHQFNFEQAFYSLTPLDWCTGKQAIDAYTLFMRNGSERDEAPVQYNITETRESSFGDKKCQYTRSAMDTVDTFTIFIAGADWVIRNSGRGIDFSKSLDDFHAKYKEIQSDMNSAKERALSGR